MGLFSQILVVSAAACYIAGYAVYWFGLRAKHVQPNRWSWLIWSAATGIEASTYQAVNGDVAQAVVFAISAACCVAVTAGIWARSAWTAPSLTEMICVAASILALVLWGLFQMAFWAHVLIVAAVPIGFIPTWIGALRDRRHEASPAWGLWTLGDLATLILILATLQSGVHELPYIVVELACHTGVWVIVGLGSITSFLPSRTGRG